MKDLEGKLRSVKGIVGLGILGYALAFNPLQVGEVKAQSNMNVLYQKGAEEAMDINSIRNAARSRGYLTLDELQTSMFTLKDSSVREQYRFFADVINNDWLPFKAMFYLSLKKQDCDEAEIIRRSWVNYLSDRYIFAKHISQSPRKNWTYDSVQVAQKVGLQLERLQTIGLTDPTLIDLRKELGTAKNNKQWNDAEKIQNLILGRIKELKELQPYSQQVADKRTLEDRTIIVVQPQSQPSEQHIKIEQLPRYGAEDIGRAMLLLEGKGRKLSDVDLGALRIIDVILGR